MSRTRSTSAPTTTRIPARSWRNPSILIAGGTDTPAGIGIFTTGLVTLKPGSGSLVEDGPVNAGTLQIISSGTVFINGQAEEVGGSPDAPGTRSRKALTTPSSGAAANLLTTKPSLNGTFPGGISAAAIYIDATYIDVNGLIQSGQAAYTLTIPADVGTEIANLIAAGETGPMIQLPNETSPAFNVAYDTQTQQIVVSNVPVNGGYVDLSGTVLDTGDGTIAVFGGNPTIDVTNLSNYDLGVQYLDASTSGSGQLVINDIAANGNSTFSAYQYVPGTGVSLNNGPANLASSFNYQPQSSWRYGWTVVQSAQEVITRQYVNSNWINVFPTGSNQYSSQTITPVGPPHISATSAPYFYVDTSLLPSSPDYVFQQTPSTFTTSAGAWTPDGNTEVSHWYGGHTYSATFQQVNGTETDYENDISASRSISIDFTGSATAGITVTSEGTGNIELLGSVLDPNGTTTIDSQKGSITSSGSSQFLTGDNVILEAAKEVGTAAAPINVVVGGTIASLAGLGLNAFSQNGGIAVNAVTGDLPVQAVQSLSQGNINLSADGSVSVATNAAGLRPGEVLGLVQGGIIDLTSTNGGIGNSTTAPLIVNTPNPLPGLVDTVTATAETDVYLEERPVIWRSIHGDHRRRCLDRRADGSVVNANTSSTTNIQTETQLSAGVWSDLG